MLLLRGPQTPGELRTRTNRLAEFAHVQEIESTLEQLHNLNDEQLVAKLPREPGKRESRFSHLFCGEPDIGLQASDNNPQPPKVSNTTAPQEALNRIDALEQDVHALKKQVQELKELVDILTA